MDNVEIYEKLWGIISELRHMTLDEVSEAEEESIASLFGGIEGYDEDGVDETELLKFASAISNVFWNQESLEQQFLKWMNSLSDNHGISQEEVLDRFGMYRVQWVGAVVRFFTEEVTRPSDLCTWLWNALDSGREPPWHPAQWERDQQISEEFYSAVETSGYTLIEDSPVIEQKGVGWEVSWTCPKGWVVLKTPSSPMPFAAHPALREGFFTNMVFGVERFDGALDRYINIIAHNAVKMGIWAEYNIVFAKNVDLSRIGVAAESIFVAEGFGPRGHHLQAVSYCWELGSLKATMSCTALLDSDWDLLRIKLVDTLRTLNLTPTTARMWT